MISEAKLLERTSRSVHDGGQMRLVRDHWRRAFGMTDRVEYDLVELPDGTKEVRIRSTQ